MPKDTVIRYTNYCGAAFRQKIAGFSVGNGPWVTCFPQPQQMKAICPCGADDWTDNGRTMNEYECACCGEFILTEPKQEKINDK